jgi:hypothetical protein
MTLWVMNDRFAVFARCPLLPRNRPNRCAALSNVSGQKRTKCTAAKILLSDHLVGESTRVLAPPIAHGTNDRAEIATLCGEDVLGSRGTHRIEASLDDAILLKRPQTLR